MLASGVTKSVFEKQNPGSRLCATHFRMSKISKKRKRDSTHIDNEPWKRVKIEDDILFSQAGFYMFEELKYDGELSPEMLQKQVKYLTEYDKSDEHGNASDMDDMKAFKNEMGDNSDSDMDDDKPKKKKKAKKKKAAPTTVKMPQPTPVTDPEPTETASKPAKQSATKDIPAKANTTAKTSQPKKANEPKKSTEKAAKKVATKKADKKGEAPVDDGVKEEEEKEEVEFVMLNEAEKRELYPTLGAWLDLYPNLDELLLKGLLDLGFTEPTSIQKTVQ